MYLDDYRGMERKQTCTGERERKTQLKEETEEKQRRTKQESKSFADSDKAAWSCLFKQHCGNQRLAPQWERQHLLIRHRGLITEECCAEPAAPPGKPETPLSGQPPDRGAQELPAGHRRGCR